MKRLRSFLLFGMMAVLLSTLVAPLAAQDVPGPGEGAPIVESNLGSDIATLNPILSNDGSSNTVIARMFPSFIGVDPVTASFMTGVGGSLVTDYTVSDDGLTYTFTLRDDWNWSDGTPITSQDYKYAFDAIASGETDTALTYVLDTVAAVEAPDPNTVVVTLKSPNCAALSSISAVPVVPSHVYSENFPTFADMNDASAEFEMLGAVSAERFKFSNFRPGEQVTLVADQNYPDAQLGHVVPEGWVFKNIAEENLIWEQFKNGDLTFAGPPEDKNAEARELAQQGALQLYEAPATSLRFISFNLADPTNPQNGLVDPSDPTSEVIDQGKHPILGDVRVRQALMYAMNWDELNEKALGGEGIQLASHVLPVSWAFDESLEPYPFDLERANELLTEAGWVDDDNNPDTPRVAQGSETAPDGTPLAFKLETNSGNNASESIGVLLQAQWKNIGVDLDFQTIDFNVLVDNLTGQTYDAIMIFWGFSIPDNPDDARANFYPTNDVVGSGFNVSSYNNPRVNELLDAALVVPGCDQEARAEIYHQVYEILKEDVPWIWVNTNTIPTAAQPDLQNWDPQKGAIRWNIDAWYPAAR